jgi:tetratricopeptide (TPR) repeat protein
MKTMPVSGFARNRVMVVLIVLFLSLFYSFSACSETFTLDGETQFVYAKKLFEKGDYASSMVEFKRFIHYFPEDKRVGEARYTMGLCWFNGGRFQDALQIFEDIYIKTPEDSFAIEACFMAAKCHERNGNSVLGAVELQNVIRSAKNDRVKNRGLYELGFLHLDNGSWDKAVDALSKISQEGRTFYSVDQILSELTKTGEIPRKNPTAAGVFSIVPGGGFLYCGRPRDALVSFLINGGLIYSAVRSFKREDYGLGGVVAFVGFGFYAGNIYGSVASAHKYNREQNRRFVRDLKKKIPVTLGFIADPDLGHGLSLSYGF